MSFPVIGVLDKGDISLDNLLDYIIGSQVMLHRVKLRLCADMVNGRIKQIAFARLKLLYRPVIPADIFLACKLTVFIGIVHIYKLFALEDTVLCTRQRSVPLWESLFSVALGDGNGKLLQNIGEAAACNLFPFHGRCLIFGNDIADSSIHFFKGIRCLAADKDILKGCNTVFIGYGIFVYGNAGERSTVKVEGYALHKVILRGFDNLNIATL